MQFNDAKEAISVALRVIFERWTALRLVVEHQFGGAPYEAEKLLEAATAMAIDPAKRHSEDDFVDLFYSTFDRINTDIEDGSPEEVAMHIVSIRNAASEGNFEPAVELAQKAGVSPTAKQSSVEGGTNSDDEFPVQRHAAPITGSQPRAHRAPVVDEDGFTQVASKRRNR